jgi:hypothetical protein
VAEALPEGRYRIEDLRLRSPSLEVWGVEGWRRVPGWRLHEVDLALKDGRPFGSVLFRAFDGRSARVGVRWNHVSEQLHCFVTDTSLSEVDRQGLELDVRGRVGTLIATYAAIGASAVTTPVAASGTRAAAHLLPELPPATG